MLSTGTLCGIFVGMRWDEKILIGLLIEHCSLNYVIKEISTNGKGEKMNRIIYVITTFESLLEIRKRLQTSQEAV